MASRRLIRQLSTQPRPAGLPRSVHRALETIADPFALLAGELGQLKQSLRALVGSDDHGLGAIAAYYLAAPHQGKHLRPTVVLLIAQAAAPAAAGPAPRPVALNQPLSPAHILNDPNPSQPRPAASAAVDLGPILPTQRRLAEIAELIHVSSLLHDDVIDQAESRRGRPSAPRAFGSKLAVLAGDFLLARASLALSRLANFEVIELVSSIIANLVQGELLQLDSILNHPQQQPADGPGAQPAPPPASFDDRLFAFYERKNYLKTASLIAKTSRATVLLSPAASTNRSLVEASYEYGKHLGLAFQIVDDILDYTGSDETLGKAANGSDLKAGLVTGPGLYAWKQHPEKFGELVARKFCRPGDLELACEMVQKADGISQAYQLASSHLQRCRESLELFEPSEAKQGLHALCDLVLNRNH
ncbi:hypothetical protein PtB15_1B555 [Puccinia triticina]|nr:hypothetical protein PtB15_1B555 [Puccinia triticina]